MNNLLKIHHPPPRSPCSRCLALRPSIGTPLAGICIRDETAEPVAKHRDLVEIVSPPLLRRRRKRILRALCTADAARKPRALLHPIESCAKCCRQTGAELQQEPHRAARVSSKRREIYLARERSSPLRATALPRFVGNWRSRAHVGTYRYSRIRQRRILARERKARANSQSSRAELIL